MKTEEKLNLTMLCDFYELTMGNGYFRAGLQDRITYFDVFFRNVPDNGGFAVCAGLEQLVQYIQNLHFDEEDIALLAGHPLGGRKGVREAWHFTVALTQADLPGGLEAARPLRIVPDVETLRRLLLGNE